MPPKLPAYEWCFILLFCSILLLLAGFALSGNRKLALPPEKSSHEEPLDALEVSIEGAVAKPGLYRLPLNTTIKELVERAEPLSEADLSQVKLRRKLYDGQKIRVPEKKWMTIYVTGAVVQPGSFKILSGTRYYELAEQLVLSPEADLKALKKKKRILKSEESVHIPTKIENRNRSKKTKTKQNCPNTSLD